MKGLAVLAAAVGLVACGLALGTRAAGLWVNATPSMPEGIYRLSTLDQDVARGDVARGDVIAICPSAGVLAVAVPRHYLAPGPCAGNVEPLLKHVAAVSGDRVVVSEHGVSVNGRSLPNSRRFARDCAGRPLPQIAAGRYTIPPHSVWLYAPVERSWDSRYFGAQPTAGILGRATPVLIVGNGNPACAS